MARYRKIFAALDGGDTQEAVARRALSIAHDNNAEVLFGHVIDATRVETGIHQEELASTTKQAIEKNLSRYLKRAAVDTHIPSVEIKVAMGKIQDVLDKELITPYHPDLVICGVRGLSSIKYAFVGSVSTHLVHHMECDVLVVHPESIEAVNYEEYEPFDEGQA